MNTEDLNSQISNEGLSSDAPPKLPYKVRILAVIRFWPIFIPPFILICVGVLTRVELFCGEKPHLSPDSESYIEPALTILNEGKPFSQLRPPIYPVFLAANYLFFGKGANDAVVQTQHLLGIITFILYFYVFLIVVRERWVALFASAVFSMDYKVLSYEGMILSETLCIFLMAALALTLILYLRADEYPKGKILALILAIQALLILTKPFFILLPLMLAIPFILRWHSSGLRSRDLAMQAGIYFLISLLPILMWQSTNYYVYGRFEFSRVKVFNLFGKILQTKQYVFAPASYAPIKTAIENHKEYNPYFMANILIDEGNLQHTDDLVEFSHAAISARPSHFLIRNIKLIPTVLCAEVYPSSGTPSASAKRPLSRFIRWLNRYTNVNWNTKFLLVFISIFCLFLAGPWRRQVPTLFWWQNGVLVLLVFYSLIISTFAGYTDYGRLMIMVSPLKQYFCFLFMPYLIYSYFKYRLEGFAELKRIGE